MSVNITHLLFAASGHHRRLVFILSLGWEHGHTVWWTHQARTRRSGRGRSYAYQYWFGSIRWLVSYSRVNNHQILRHAYCEDYILWDSCFASPITFLGHRIFLPTELNFCLNFFDFFYLRFLLGNNILYIYIYRRPQATGQVRLRFFLFFPPHDHLTLTESRVLCELILYFGVDLPIASYLLEAFREKLQNVGHLFK